MRSVKISQKLIISVGVLLIVLLGTILFSRPTLAAADSNVVQTTFFGNIEDDGSGCGVYTILNSALDILSIGVGILGVIGISVVGIKYLTSAGNEEQARTSRRRIFEILIGLAVYAVLYAGINWLTPGGKLNTGSDCSTVSDQELQQKRAAADAERKAKQQQTNKSSGSSSSGGGWF